MKTVGVIGLGNMGRGMAGSLRRGDYTVLGYDAAPGVALALAGQEVLSARDSVAEIARDADVLLLSLPTSAVVEAVVLGAGGVVEEVRTGTIA
ncbi:NAD(P)-binding domain-containing protein, partial [Burkholderia gladioli]|uniref:NAD(P)-binding domain-containing protein n=1 Tax=Burkholderia gladioli TaxID=28095 RepID=UPI0034DB262D